MTTELEENNVGIPNAWWWMPQTLDPDIITVNLDHHTYTSKHMIYSFQMSKDVTNSRPKNCHGEVRPPHNLQQQMYSFEMLNDRCHKL